MQPMRRSVHTIGFLCLLCAVMMIPGYVPARAAQPASTARVFFQADDGAKIRSVYSASVVDGSRTKLIASARLGGLGTLGELDYDSKLFAVSADGKLVVFRNNGVFYSVNSTATNPAPVELGGKGLLVSFTALSPDGAYLALTTNPRVSWVSLPTAGGSPITLAATTTTNDTYPLFTADSKNVIFSAILTKIEGPGLFVSPLNVATPAKLTPRLPVGAGIMSYVLSPDGRYVVYALTEGNKATLYSIPVSGGEAALLAPDYSPNFPHMFFTPDSRSVIYLTNVGTGARNLLKIVPISGGAARPLNDKIAGAINPAIVPNYQNPYADVRLLNKLFFTPDGQYLLVQKENPLAYSAIPSRPLNWSALTRSAPMRTQIRRWSAFRRMAGKPI